MKRFVLSDIGHGCITGAIVGSVAIIAHFGAALTYLIALIVLVLWIGVRLGPERVQLWREERSKEPATKP